MSTTQAEAAVQSPALNIAANMFNLSGGGVTVSYSASGIDGKPHMSYQDATRSLSFTGDEISKLEGDLASVVSVTIVRTVDAGSTSFSLLVPRVNLAAPFGSIAICSDGITTNHAFSVVPALNLGQRDFYSVTPMQGTASHVVF